MYEANQQTLRMASFCIEGNVIDHSWYSIIKNECGLTDGTAILLLADIVYWYRPSYQVDPKTGEAKIGKKFKSDILQRSYIDIEKQTGFTKRQAQEAFKTLESLDICHRELRTVEINGVKVSNILFIRLNDSKLASLRENYYKNTEELKNCISSYENCHKHMTKLSQANDKIVTYTYNTTKTSTEISPAAATTREAKESESQQVLSAAAVGEKSSFSSETIHFKTPGGKNKSISASEIYTYFLKSNLKTEVIAEAIQIAKLKQEPIGNILKLIETICISIETKPQSNIQSKGNSSKAPPKSTEEGITNFNWFKHKTKG